MTMTHTKNCASKVIGLECDCGPTGKLNAYTIQMLTRYDAYSNTLSSKYHTKEYRRAYATSEGAAIRMVHCGPYDAIGRVTKLPMSKRELSQCLVSHR